MAPHAGPLLVDTNVIIECHRIHSWRALTQRYRTETVETCLEESQTGAQTRNPEQQIDEGELRHSLAAVQLVSASDLAQAMARDGEIGALDPGEKHLWAHALTREDAWILCGPDGSSMRMGVRLGLRDRLVALEGLLDAIGHRPKPPLRNGYTNAWLKNKLNQFAAAEIGPRR